MARRRTNSLVNGARGEHIGLSLAANLARSQLCPSNSQNAGGKPYAQLLDIVANALAQVAPLYILDTLTGDARELSAAELEGANVRSGATLLALKDGRVLTTVSMRRVDLAKAIRVLEAIGLPQLPRPPQKQLPAEPVRARISPLEVLEQLESMLAAGDAPTDLRKANSLAVLIARHAGRGPVVNLAMQLVTAIAHGDPASGQIPSTLAQLRAALQEQGTEPGARPA